MKKVFLLICLLTVLLSASCSAFKTYEDTNGEDNYSLQQISEDMLINDKGGVKIASISTSITKDGVTNIKLSVGEFNGVDEIYAFKKGSYVVTVNYKVNSGNTRLVITDGIDIIKDFKINEENQVFEFSCDGKYYLKLAGESCKYDLTVEIKKA